GRMTSRGDPEGTSTFTFGTSATAHNIGRLAGMSGPGYSEGYTYDSIGRLQQRSITSDATYFFDYTYNNEGGLDTLTYPVSTSSYRLKLQYEYGSGQLLRVKDFAAPGTVFWRVNSADAWGHVIDETLGNGVQTFRGFDLATGVLDSIQSSGPAGSIQDLDYAWDAVGNLTQRHDARQNLTENFFYDNLHRLTSTTGPDAMTVGYDARGNIMSRTGNVSPSPTHTMSWYSFNLPNTISASGSQSSQFFYAPDRSRWRQLASYAGTSEETIYIGGMVEKVTLGTVISWKHYIAGASGPVAVYTRKSTGTNELHYLTRDHLGSIDSVTNSAGVPAVRLSFSAFGQRRDEDNWTGNPTSGDWAGITNTSRRGFTFHEMLDNLNFTHMNGRVYDQVIGQFTSPDPFVQAPGFTQSFNRYAYTFNSPLSYTDPSGYAATSDSHTARDDCVDNCHSQQPTIAQLRFVTNSTITSSGGFGDSLFGNGRTMMPDPTPRSRPIESSDGLCGAQSCMSTGDFEDYSDPYKDPGVTFAVTFLDEGKAYTYRELTLAFGSNTIFTEEVIPNCHVRPVDLQPGSCDRLGDVAFFENVVPFFRRMPVKGPFLFGQANVRSVFAGGPYAGRTIGEIAAALRSGAISADTLPIEFVVRNGRAITLNNRSLLALRRAGLRPTVTRNLTGNPEAESLLNRHLRGRAPSDVIRVRGGPPGTSLIE
ncbi:MAG TPA: RHS repeat-associated core domain-containing protein, partial [Gemmatimonadaceae bacterium]|nr:RHS repeat-associated core domain-containing protein [Gemmatimonadaceae bacterium]